MTNRGLLVVLSGPSGAGKGTVLKYLLEQNRNVRLSISATTREPRPGESDGREYYFMTRERFERMAQGGEMLESAEYCGNCYGTPAAPVDAWIAGGSDVILEIEVQGGSQVKKKRPDAVSIFVLPPSLKVLEHRLRKRGTESEEAVQKRLAAARGEIPQAENYDYVVVNDTAQHAAAVIAEIILAEKHSSRRNADLIERMLQYD